LASAKEIPPGGDGRIDVSFKTGGDRGGKRQKHITVTTNDPKQPALSLKVSTDVQVILDVEPGRIPFGQIKKDGGETVRYTALAGNDRDKVKITSVESKNEFIKVETNLKGFEGDPKKQIKVTVLPGMKAGRFSERVLLHTDHKDVKELPLYVMGEVLGKIATSPTIVNFGILQKGKSVERVITLRATTDTPFKVLEVKSTLPDVVAELETVKPGSEYRIRATLKDSFSGNMVRGKILIKTSDKEQPDLELNVFGRIPLQRPQPPVVKKK